MERLVSDALCVLYTFRSDATLYIETYTWTMVDWVQAITFIKIAIQNQFHVTSKENLICVTYYVPEIAAYNI